MAQAMCLMNRLPIDNYEVMARAPLPVLQEEGPSIPRYPVLVFGVVCARV